MKLTGVCLRTVATQVKKAQRVPDDIFPRPKHMKSWLEVILLEKATQGVTNLELYCATTKQKDNILKVAPKGVRIQTQKLAPGSYISNSPQEHWNILIRW